MLALNLKYDLYVLIFQVFRSVLVFSYNILSTWPINKTSKVLIIESLIDNHY